MFYSPNLYNFILFYLVFLSLVVFLSTNSILHLLSFFIMNCSKCTNRKWNYGYVSVLPFICVSCSLTIEEVGCPAFPLK